MILINCPYCGERDQSEFSNGGEAHVARPENSEHLNDKEWGKYVFYRDNPKGIFYERWVHTTDWISTHPLNTYPFAE